MLKVDLQTGFSGQKVRLTMNEAELFSKDSVETQKLIGLAESVTINQFVGVPCVVNLEVEGFPACSIELTEAREGAVFIGVFIDKDNRLKHIISKKPFGYG